jgi:ABC-type glycerol-3-phosphate transport system substrate-binding protein
MIHKKQFLAAALSALDGGTLAGCGASAAGNDDACLRREGPILLMHINGENQGGAAVQEFIDTFNASQDEIEVRAGSTPAMMSAQNSSRYAAGNAPPRPGVLGPTLSISRQLLLHHPEEIVSNTSRG